MHKNLYFIPIITEAFNHADTKTALREAFELIHSMGKEAQYHRGYQQFIHFLGSVGESLWEKTPEQVVSLLRQAMERSSPCDIHAECDGQIVGMFSINNSYAQTIAGIVPGFYHLKFETGLLLWQGEVLDKDVLWTSALPGKSLNLAADTESAKRQPTRTINLSENGLILRFYAGIEAGFMELEMKASEDME